MTQSLRVRIPYSIYEHIRVDLARTHEYAAERVGFLSTSLKTYPDGSSLLLVTDYQPVADDQYLVDYSVGARIGSGAIRAVLQRSLDTRRGAFHVHAHLGKGVPTLSKVDRGELPRLARSFQSVLPDQAHGIFLFSEDSCTCWVFLPGVEDAVSPELITIVGHPLVLINPSGWAEDETNKRFSRQSFLGALAQTLIENVCVGIIGLGGGGSHIVQQLAHIGVQHFRWFDGDIVDESNLNRMVGALASDPDNGTPKVKVARRMVNGLVSNAVIMEYQGDWKKCPELLEQCELVFGCVDTFAGRRDIESTCRRYLIPYIDVGMDVHKIGDEPPRMAGQVILSMPGSLCMTCIGFLNERRLAAEAAHYGNVGGRPQVIWANGVLASAAIGIGIELLTGWTKRKNEIIALSYDGNIGTITPDVRLHYLLGQECTHFPLTSVGPPVWS